MVSVKTIGIVGTGQMGIGIAEVFLKYFYTVFLYDNDANALQTAEKKIRAFFEKQKEKTPDLPFDKIVKNIFLAPTLQQLNQCDIIIEAATENFSIKTNLLQNISQHLQEKGLLVTNTSSLSLKQLSHFVKFPERFMGMHFMNPVPVIPLVELIKSDKTNDQTVEAVAQAVKSIEKTVVYSKDSPGFIVNRILIPMIHEAIVLLENKVGSATDIDTAMCLGTNQPIGPLALADLIGLDTCLAIMEILQKDLNSDKYKPCGLLLSMVNEGFLGRKTKQGFYQY